MNILFKFTKTGKVQQWRCWHEGSEVVAEFGQENGKLQVSRTQCIATNTGRSNQRDPEQQAVFEVIAAYEDQINNKHYRHTIEEAQVVVDACNIPMKINNYKDHGHKINDECYGQRKFNGSRRTVIDGKFIAKSGRVEECTIPEIQRQVDVLGLDFDAETYAHGLSLQRIRSAWLSPMEDKINKRGQNSYQDSKLLKLVIFDIPVKGVSFYDKVDMLSHIAEIIHRNNLDRLVVEMPTLLNTRDEHDKFFDDALAENYEGVVYRNIDSVFEFGVRSYQTQKRKPRYDAEAKVVSVTKDKRGNGVLSVVASDALDNVKFKCVMKVERRDGKSYSKDYDTMLELVGHWITFSYEELSDSGIPTKPVGELERECDESGEPLV
tara:strand:- start:352 stop:1488 length:1137 start_codon:yes stop_codon:yes gene_type:complete